MDFHPVIFLGADDSQTLQLAKKVSKAQWLRRQQTDPSKRCPVDVEAEGSARGSTRCSLTIHHPHRQRFHHLDLPSRFVVSVCHRRRRKMVQMHQAFRSMYRSLAGYVGGC